MKKHTSKKKVLLVAGCSHSCGHELEGPGIYGSQYNIDNCFGSVLSKIFDLKHVNIALAGCSNKVIISNVVHHTNLLLTEYDPKEIIVLVGWTAFARSEVVVNNRLYNFSINSDQHPEWILQPAALKKYHKTWQKLLDNQLFNNDHIVNYELLKSFLGIRQVSYFFFNAVNCLEQSDRNLFHVHDDFRTDFIGYQAARNDPNYFHACSFEHIFYKYLKKRYDPCQDGRWHHFGKEAHAEWAEVLKPWIQQHIQG